MTTKLLRYLASLGGVLFSATQSPAVNITVLDSVVSLATNGTKHYTFKDPASGESVIVKVSIRPFSGGAGDPFTLCDSKTRVAVGYPFLDDEEYIDDSEGLDLTASLAFASRGVTANSVRFRIAGLGLYSLPLISALNWTSSVLTAKPLPLGGESLRALDDDTAPLGTANYFAQLRSSGGAYLMSDAGALAGQSLKLNATFNTTTADPHANSWLTTYAGRYARIYKTPVARTNGVSVTTWTNTPVNNHKQTLPAYCGVQEIYSSVDSVYIRSTGLGSYVMGSWTNAPLGVPFPNLPTNQHSLFQFPRAPSVPVTKTNSAASTIGYFVDGVAMFNSWSGFLWLWDGKNMTNLSGPSPGGYWNADAYVTEGATFDPGLGHPESKGIQHYHANPIALRYQLGDHVDFNPATKVYSESASAATKHSPILGWVSDGFPIYGPYGYSSGSNATSGVRRMVSGYVKRDGNWGTDNLTNAPTPPATSQRTTRPLWAQRLVTPDPTDPKLPLGPVHDARIGPPVDPTNYPLGYYMEDYDYLGDHGYTQGVDFDLDEFNGRWCVTPEFPAGTYAYFVALTETNAPMFPYNIGRGYYGEPTGSIVIATTGILTTNFLGGTNLPLVLNTPKVGGGKVVLTWSAVEGGTYQVERTVDFIGWTVLATNAPAILDLGSYTNATSEPKGFYRAKRQAVAPFDPVN